MSTGDPENSILSSHGDSNRSDADCNQQLLGLFFPDRKIHSYLLNHRKVVFFIQHQMHFALRVVKRLVLYQDLNNDQHLMMN